MSQRTLDLSSLLADVQRASSMVAPVWPLSSFVAVNPLGGLEHLPFEAATQRARELTGASTHLSLPDFRQAHAEGGVTTDDLRRVVADAHPELTANTVELADASVPAIEVIVHDLLFGPTAADDGKPVDPMQVAIDDHLSTWCAAFVDTTTAAWTLPADRSDFFTMWRSVVTNDRAFRRTFGPEAVGVVDGLDADPLRALAAAFDRAGIAPADRQPVLEALVVRLPGWAGYARWCDEWAPADHAGPHLRLVDLVTARAVIEAATGQLRRPHTAAPSSSTRDRLLHARIDTVVADMASGSVNDTQRSVVFDLLGDIDEDRRRHLFLCAHERNFQARLVAALEPQALRPTRTIDAQVVMCIDVRSEGMRRHLEQQGTYETFGFAGFFGVPVRWRPLGSDLGEARCPVLVSPKHEISETSAAGIAEIEGYLDRAAARGAAHEAFHGAKKHLGAPFALAEASGWITGPLAAAKTLLPGRKRTSSATPATTADVAGDGTPEHTTGLANGLSLDERCLFAEAIVRTIGMQRFAPLVVLCGHASATVNNPHASALDCGACGGAPGGPSARIAAAILNDPDVRQRLVESGIEIPDSTQFVAAEHDTVSDRVTILDEHLIPASHVDRIRSLERDLETAGVANSAQRALRLPGHPADVRDRGSDWAQVRPEWGLAGNAAIVIAPRAATEGVDLASRVFLHSYDAEADADAVALETIMTAPLVVAQWICSQYYFSTVDNDVYGAGDKMLHNPVGGTVGVVRGRGGDLAVGLPLQSVSAGNRRGHDPLRLTAFIEAPLERIDEIIARNSGVRQLVDGGWVHLIARPRADAPWSLRTGASIWETWSDAEPRSANLELAHG